MTISDTLYLILYACAGGMLSGFLISALLYFTAWD